MVFVPILIHVAWGLELDELGSESQLFPITSCDDG